MTFYDKTGLAGAGRGAIRDIFHGVILYDGDDVFFCHFGYFRAAAGAVFVSRRDACGYNNRAACVACPDGVTGG